MNTPKNQEQILAEEFPLTSEEEEWIKTSLFAGVETKELNEFAGRVHLGVLTGYESGEMNFEKIMNIVRSCSLACSIKYRTLLLGMTAEKALKITPKYRGASPPKYSKWQRETAEDLLLMSEKKGQDLSKGLEFVRALFKLFSDDIPAESTLRKWHHENKKRLNLPVKKPGRPRK